MSFVAELSASDYFLHGTLEPVLNCEDFSPVALVFAASVVTASKSNFTIEDEMNLLRKLDVVCEYRHKTP